MKQDNIVLLKEIQKNTKQAMTVIDTLLDKTEQDDFTLHLARQSVAYAKIHNDAVERLIEEKEETYRNSQLNDMMLRGNIHANTLLNTSTSHLAEIMIEESNKELTSLYKAVKHHNMAEDVTVELAQELMNFEIKNIEVMKDYL